MKTAISVFVCVAIVVLIVGMAVKGLRAMPGPLTYTNENPSPAFNAWVKLTGNNSRLTYEEWYALLKTGALQNQDTHQP